MYIGIDLGGTNIAAGLVDGSGNLIYSNSTPTLADRPFEVIMKDMADLTKGVIAHEGYSESDILGIGIGSPGTIDNKNGIVAYSNNIPSFNNAHVVEEMKKYLTCR